MGDVTLSAAKGLYAVGEDPHLHCTERSAVQVSVAESALPRDEIFKDFGEHQ